jgi:hypothetical protein
VAASARRAAKGCAEHSISRNWLSQFFEIDTNPEFRSASALDELDKDRRG